MLVSPQILVWFQDLKSSKIPKLQWHRVRLDGLQAVVLAAVVEVCDFAACFIYLSFVPGRTLRRQFGSLARQHRYLETLRGRTIPILDVHESKLHILRWVQYQMLW